MKILFRLSFLVLLTLSQDLFSQIKFQHVYGGVDSTQDGLDVKQTNDGGYILNARVTTNKSNLDCENAYVLKIDPNGNLQWSKTYEGSNCEEGRGIVQTTDGGYFYAGESKTWSAGGTPDFDVFATKLNAAGTIQWTYNYGDVWNDAAYTGQQTADGGYMAFGASSNFSTNGYADYYLLKLSNTGAIQWSHTFGGTYFDFGYDAMQTNDGGYIMTGSSFSFGSGYSFYTIKADVNGTFQWGKAVNGFADEYAYGVTQTNDGGYLACGGTTGFGLGGTDILLVKMASDGNVSWMKNYGGFQNECGFTVQQTMDGGFAVCGGTNSVGNGGYDLFLMKTNSAGNLLWTKTYGGSMDDGFSGGMFFTFSNVNADVSMTTTSDGGFAITSQTNSFGTGHVYLIKTDSDGNSGCNETNGPFMEGVPTLSVMAAGAQTNPVQMTGTPTPMVTIPSSKDTNVCCVPPVAMAGNDVTICQGASATLNASGGTNYNWNTGQSTSSIIVTPAATTTFIVTVSDFCGNDKDTVIVTVKPLPTSNAGVDVTICPGGNVTLNGTTNGTTYVWNPGGQTTTSVSVSPSITTTYTFSATNSCGTQNDSVKVVISNSITANISGNLTICPGASTTLSASGGSTYVWSTGASANPIIVSPTGSTTYSVIANSGTCSDTVAVNVTVAPGLSASIASNVTICSGQSTTLTASGGTNYSWNTGATTTSVIISPTNTSTYSVVVSSGGCSDTATALVTVTPNIIFTVTPASICLGSTATIGATGGGTYQWSTGSTTSSIVVSPTTTSSYTVQVSSGVCTGTAVATVNVSTPITAVISGNTTVCSGSSSTLSVNGGTSYTWNTGQTTSSISITPTGAASYSVIVTNGACSDTAYATVSVAPPLNINAPGAIICNGASATLSSSVSGGTSPFTYSWSPGGQTTSSVTVSPASSSNYSVTVSDDAGCSSVISIPVTVLAAPTIGVTGNISICTGSSTTLTANGGVSYVWNTGTTTASLGVTPSATASYTVTGTDGNGCTNTLSVTVTVSQPPTASISGNDTVCAGDPSILTAAGGGNYLWNTGATTAVVSVSPTTTTNYSVLITMGGCTATATYSVAVIPSPTANAGTSVSISLGETTTLNASGGGTYSWNNGMSTQSISVSPTASTQYCVLVTDLNGCSDSSCVWVYVKPLDCPDNVYIPNAFSPNTDNENDFFQAYFVSILCVKEFKLKLYDRWGEEIVNTTDASFKWDGTYKGKIEDTEVFTYYVYVKFTSGTEVTKKGNVSLVR